VSETGHSEDQAWWWDGRGWLPAFSADRKWWFDGRAWIRLSPPHRLAWPRWLIISEGIWGLSLLLPPGLLMYIGVSDQQIGKEAGTSLITVTVVAVLATFALGFSLGRARFWRHVPVAALCGTAVLAVVYVIAMLATAQPDDTMVDNAVGAGLSVLGIPTFVLLLAALGASAGTGRLLSRRPKVAA
jgi:peptidoglycan/LPS O-acetylase OafA/YrhL